jgi:hypothetical protein
MANARSYSFTGSLHDAEYDHFVPLELGGDPNDPRNLWVEPPSPHHVPGSGVNNPKDIVENQANALVCSHRVSLAAMQTAIVQNWTTAIARVTHTTRPTGHGGRLSCSASVSNAHPPQYSVVTVYVATSAGAAVSVTAHYLSKDTTQSGQADSSGTTAVSFYISRATVGYTVAVSVVASLAGSSASCRTAFTPQQ